MRFNFYRTSDSAAGPATSCRMTLSGEGRIGYETATMAVGRALQRSRLRPHTDFTAACSQWPLQEPKSGGSDGKTSPSAALCTPDASAAWRSGNDPVNSQAEGSVPTMVMSRFGLALTAGRMSGRNRAATHRRARILSCGEARATGQVGWTPAMAPSPVYGGSSRSVRSLAERRSQEGREQPRQAVAQADRQLAAVHLLEREAPRLGAARV
jgi:hypothetical protein